MNVRFRPQTETASGRRKGWMKHVTACDETKNNGYAFDGEFLSDGREIELPVGSIIIRVDPQGSVKNNWQSAHALRLEIDGKLTELTPGADADLYPGSPGLDWRDDFLSFRDIVCAALRAESQVPADNPLAGFSDADLLAEISRRKLSCA